MNNNNLHKRNNLIKIISPSIFNESDHLYECVLNKKIHKTVEYFFSLNKSDYIEIYCKKYNNINIKKELLYKIFSYQPKYFHS
jgi:hypothetical protein